MASFLNEFEHLRIRLEEIKKATNNFGNKVIGSGGFGAVYQGEVLHSKGRSIVAIKRLNRQFGQGDPEFLKEIMMLSRYRHQNIISLLGFCDEEDEKVLVYEYASKGSLDRYLSDPGLTWTQRIKICLGAAKGLSYLHDPRGAHQRVLHCDIKSANILLDENMTAKVADFGLSKMGPANQQHSLIVTNALGTAGYCDPLFMTNYTLTKESDVYSFGVVLFEVLCGRLCCEYNNGQFEVFVNMWKKSYLENKLNEIVFQHLGPQMDPTSLELFSNVAFQCWHNSREGRPTMSIVVEKLEKALEFQKLYDLRLKLKLPQVYIEIINVAVPLTFGSIEDLNKLFSNGIFLNDRKTWFSRNDHAAHYVLISLAECLTHGCNDELVSQYSTRYNSRFEVGCYSTYGKAFKTRVKTQFLSPLITYGMNLVFKFTRTDQLYKHEYLCLTYTLNGEKKISIVHLANKRKDEWLKAKLHEFTSHERTVDLEIYFHEHLDCYDFQIEGIEFQPLEKVEVELHQVLELKYGEILKATAHPLVFRYEAELNAFLSKGVLINDDKMWFSRNEKGEHYVLHSIRECLIREEGESYDCRTDYNSRFPGGSYDMSYQIFKARVKTEFLSPLVTYTVNLVFKFIHVNNVDAKEGRIWLDYKLDGETQNQVSHFAYKREDDDWWTVELYHFTSDGTAVDLEIIFEGSSEEVTVDGIEFQPLEKEELQVLEDDHKHANMEPALSDSEDDTYWENKLPSDYKDIIKFSRHGLKRTTKKELYHIFSQGLMINYKLPFSFFKRPTNHEQQWFCLDKNGKTCLMLPARAVCTLETRQKEKLLCNWKSIPESRFGEGLVCSSSDTCKYIVIKENTVRVLSPQTQYACYLVYKTERGGCMDPLLVWPLLELHKYVYLSKWEHVIYLVGPQTPVIRPKAGENTHNPLYRPYRPKLKGIPRQRSDGWMEVQVWEFQTDTTMTVIPSLRLEYLSRSDFYSYHRTKYLDGLTIIGIEFRPI